MGPMLTPAAAKETPDPGGGRTRASAVVGREKERNRPPAPPALLPGGAGPSLHISMTVSRRDCGREDDAFPVSGRPKAKMPPPPDVPGRP